MIAGIDYKMLREQKQTLLKVIDRSSAFRYQQEEDDLTGLLHVIDAVQDEAVKKGVCETEVFGESKDE